MRVLEGTVVLDLCGRYPGAYTTMFLGDFGAKVIKIDRASKPLVGSADERFAAYYALDRNKKSIVINLKNPEGLKIFYTLVEQADVLVEGFRPGAMDRLNAGYNALKKINERLVYCSLSGYGQTGPYASLPGHDLNYTAIGGCLSLIGEKKGRPYLPGNFIGDMAGAGLHGAIGILLALIAREKTGCGQFVDIAYLDGVLSLLSATASFYFASGAVPRRGETLTTGSSPWINLFKCKDEEYITIGCLEPHLWENLCKVLEQNELLAYTSTNPPHQEKQDEIISILAKIFLTKTSDEWFELAKEKELPITPVYYLDETLSDPHVEQRMVLELEHPKFGKVKQLDISIKLSNTPGEVRSLGVVPGANSDEILLNLGLSKEEIVHLRKVGAVGA